MCVFANSHSTRTYAVASECSTNGRKITLSSLIFSFCSLSLSRLVLSQRVHYRHFFIEKIRFYYDSYLAPHFLALSLWGPKIGFSHQTIIPHVIAFFRQYKNFGKIFSFYLCTHVVLNNHLSCCKNINV